MAKNPGVLRSFAEDVLERVKGDQPTTTEEFVELMVADMRAYPKEELLEFLDLGLQEMCTKVLVAEMRAQKIVSKKILRRKILSNEMLTAEEASAWVSIKGGSQRFDTLSHNQYLEFVGYIEENREKINEAADQWADITAKFVSHFEQGERTTGDVMRQLRLL